MTPGWQFHLPEWIGFGFAAIIGWLIIYLLLGAPFNRLYWWRQTRKLVREIRKEHREPSQMF